MFEDLTKAISDFKKANSILIFASDISSVDQTTAIIALAKICLKKEKSLQILCPSPLSTKINDFFKKENLEVSDRGLSKNYIVSVDYSSGGIEKVICKKDEETQKLNFVITPKDNLFNFENVELIGGGSSFDLIFAFELKSLDHLEDSLKDIFVDTPLISISKQETEIGRHKFLINGKKSYSEVIYEFLKAFSDKLSDDIFEILLQGVVSKYGLLEGGNSDGWLIANNFVKYGADLNTVIRKSYYSKDSENFELQRKVMDNIRIDKESKMIWSKVASILNVDKSNLDLSGRIIFNISQDFDFAFVIYSLDNGEYKVVFESNNPKKYPASDLLKNFPGEGNESRVVFEKGEILSEDFERELFETMRTLFGVKV